MRHNRELSIQKKLSQEAILADLSQARLLFENDSSPASERALIHVEQATKLYLRDFAIKTLSPELEDFRLLCRSAELWFEEKSALWRGERFPKFFEELFERYRKGSKPTIQRNEILHCAKATRLSVGDVRGIRTLLQFLREQELLEFLGNTTYKISDKAISISKAIE